MIRICTLLLLLCPSAFGRYTYPERTHTSRERAAYLGALYLAGWATYPIFMPKAFNEHGSFSNWRDNFGEVRFDKDGPFWNWLVHPISGSQLYLIYRAGGHDRSDSFAMTFLSSALFEFAVENYTERPSIQDLYQTPVMGSLLGFALEKASMSLLNSGNSWAKALGHLLNPATLLWFYKGKVQVIPKIDGKGNTALSAIFEF